MNTARNATLPERPPNEMYDAPDDILADSALSDDEKARLLEDWEHHARRLTASQGEGMPAGKPPLLHEAIAARKLLLEKKEAEEALRLVERRPVGAGLLAFCCLVPAASLALLFDSWLWLAGGAVLATAAAALWLLKAPKSTASSR